MVVLGTAMLSPQVSRAQRPTGDSNEAAPVQVEAGQSYEGGTRVTVGNGVSWAIPANWAGGIPAESSVFILASDADAGAGAVLFVPETDLKKLAKDMNDVQDLGDGVVLEPVGEPVTGKSRVMQDYGNELLEGRALALLGPDKLAVIFFLAGSPGNLDRFGELLETMAATARFEKPAAAARTGVGASGSRKPDTAGRTGPWYDLLSGMMLKQLSSYSSGSSGGYSSETVFHLCRDGSFSWYSGGSVSVYVDGGSGGTTSESRDSGQWSVEVSGDEAYLVLVSDNGETTRHSLYYDGEKTFMNGNRYFRVQSDVCP